jgi:hypothetical protein
MNQSSAVLCFNIPNRLTSLAATKILASMKVVVVTVNTALPREWTPVVEDIGKLFPGIPQLICCIRYQVMVDRDSKLPLGLRMRSRFAFQLFGLARRPENIYKAVSSSPYATCT